MKRAEVCDSEGWSGAESFLDPRPTFLKKLDQVLKLQKKIFL